MKNRISKNKQSITNCKYAGSGELYNNERFLVNYNRDLISKLSKYYQNSVGGGGVLEFGAGIATLANLWQLKTGVKPYCLEIDPNLLAVIKKRGFKCYQSFDRIKKKFDLIYTSNVLEHIKDDQLALNKLNSKLKDGGQLIIYVPAFQILYSDLDNSMGHYRRYQKRDLLLKIKKAGFDVTRVYYSDSIGFFTWLYTKWMGYFPNKSQESMKTYDKFIFPFSKFFDALGCKFIFGKNLLVYANKSKSNLTS